MSNNNNPTPTPTPISPPPPPEPPLELIVKDMSVEVNANEPTNIILESNLEKTR